MKTELSSQRKWAPTRHHNYHRAKWVSDKELIQKVVSASRGRDEGGTVVDFGCGIGNQIAAFADRASQCIGIDADPNMLEQAVRHDKIRYVLSPVQEVDLLDADVAVARNVLHYIPGSVLGPIVWQTLKPGGIAILAQAVPPSTRSRPWHNELHDLLHVNHVPSADDMVSFLRLAHFSDIRADFSFHRMNVNEWLDARSDSPQVKQFVLEHHKKLSDYPEYEATITANQIEVTVRFAIISGEKDQ